MKNPKDNEPVEIKIPRWFAKHIFALAVKHKLKAKYIRMDKAELVPMPRPSLRVVQPGFADALGQLERLSIRPKLEQAEITSLLTEPDDEPPRPAA